MMARFIAEGDVIMEDGWRCRAALPPGVLEVGRDRRIRNCTLAFQQLLLGPDTHHVSLMIWRAHCLGLRAFRVCIHVLVPRPAWPELLNSAPTSTLMSP